MGCVKESHTAVNATGRGLGFCSCHKKLPPVKALRDIGSEAVEFVRDPSLDELSDIMYGVGRLLGGLTGREYVSVPGDGRHITKIRGRMLEYGCIRSSRHLVNGSCPGEIRDGEPQ